MAILEFCDKHNMVAYLEKPEGSAEFHQSRQLHRVYLQRKDKLRDGSTIRVADEAFDKDLFTLSKSEQGTKVFGSILSRVQ
ncbi:hypothetical protein Tco_1435105 [Tanacetum coccineum]